jgi:hypothetical protein
LDKGGNVRHDVWVLKAIQTKKTSIVFVKDELIGILNCNLFGAKDFFYVKCPWLESFLVTFVKK